MVIVLIEEERYRVGLRQTIIRIFPIPKKISQKESYSELRGTRKPRFGARLDFLSRLAAAASLYFLSSFS